MIELTSVSGAFALLSSDINAWLYLLPGLAIGLIFGAMPGISITMAMAFALPATLYMDFLPAIVFLTAIYTGAGFGGSVPAVLMGIPGTSSAVATTFDGYPMARKGLHNEALGIALASSVVGCLASYVILFVLIAPISGVVLKLGPLEMFAVAVWGMLLLGSLAGTYMSRGLLAGAFGVLLGTVGMNTAGFVRGTMGVPWLLDGVPQIPAMMGLLAASQLIGLINTTYLIEDEASRKISFAKILGGVLDQIVRVVTYDGGGPARNAVAGGVVDVGFVGGEGFLPLAEQIRPLLTFDTRKRDNWDGAIVTDVLGADADFVVGSQRGWGLHGSMQTSNPEVFKTLVGAIEAASKDPAAIEALKNQQLATDWYGPEESNQMLARTAKVMEQYIDLLKGN